MKLARRHRGSSSDISDEAAAFRTEAAALRQDLAEVRLVIADTMVELNAFSESLREIREP